MAVINVSPESFYKGSIARTTTEISDRARVAVEEGAEIIDIGGMSTSPYLEAEVSLEVETVRVRAAVRAVLDVVGEIPVSVDTLRASVADAALRDGASVVNDVSGLKGDAGMARVVRDRGASLLAMAHSAITSAERPIPRILGALRETLSLAEAAEIETRRIVLDPGIGFFRNEGSGRAFSPQSALPWYEWDLEVLANLKRLKVLGRPLCVGLSRKSFMGKILGLQDPADRLSASLALTALAVLHGANLIRTHDVKETVCAVKISEAWVEHQRGSRRAS